jgi:predicted metal-dependent hydrolase
MISSSVFKEEVIQWSKEIGVTPKELHVREMTNKWASCSTKGRLTFSIDLLSQPEKFRSEAIIHELLHLRYPDHHHSKLFKTVLNAYLSKRKIVLAV